MMHLNKLKRAYRAINKRNTMKIILITLIGIVLGQYEYSLLDNNPTSQSYQDYVGPEYFANAVTMHYFGSFT